MDVSDRIALPTRIYDLLLGLAGRLDDDALTDVREFLALASPGRAVELTLGCLVSGGIPVSRPERAELSWFVDRLLLDEQLLERVQVADQAPSQHRFTGGSPGDPAPEEGVADAVGAALRVLPDVRGIWSVWRTTPAGAIPGPVPQRVVLVEIGQAGLPAATAYRMEQALRAAGVRCVVEVLRAEQDAPKYHEAALGEARAVPLPGSSRGGRRHADERAHQPSRPEPGSWHTQRTPEPPAESPERPASRARMTGPSPAETPFSPVADQQAAAPSGGQPVGATSSAAERPENRFGAQPSAPAEQPFTAERESAGAPRTASGPPHDAPRYDAASYEPASFEPAASEPATSEPASFEAPKSETPTFESQQFDSPQFETPRFEAPKFEAAKFEAPKFEPAQFESPKFETPSYEAPKFDTPDFGASRFDRSDSQRSGAPQGEKPNAQPAQTETPQVMQRPAEAAPAERAAHEQPFQSTQHETPSYETPSYEPRMAPAEPVGFDPARGQAAETAGGETNGQSRSYSPAGFGARDVPPESANESTFVTPRVPSYEQPPPPPPRDRQAPPPDPGWRVQRPGESREPVAEQRPPQNPPPANPPAPPPMAPPERPQPPRMPMHIPGEAGLNERELGLLRQLHEELSRREQAERASNGTGSWMAAGEQSGHGAGQNGHPVNGSSYHAGGGY